jgi:hypothetical protein
MTTPTRYITLIEKVSALVERKQSDLTARHPRLNGVLAELQAGARLPFDPCGIVLGRDERGLPLVLPERPRLEHCHVIGATGSGKTNLLEHMVRQDIVLGRGALVIDPHGNHPGSLYRSLIAWLAKTGLEKSRIIHLIDPNALTHSIGFNPLDRGDAGTTFSVVAEAMFEAFNRVWGDEDGNTKPTIQRVLTATFTALGEQGLTLAESRLLFDPDDRHGIRAMVLEKLEDSYAYDEIEWLHRIGSEKGGRRDFRAEVVGPINRIAKLVRTQAMRTIVGQTSKVIDLRQAMDDGHIILCNLAGGSQVYEQGADLLGRLLTRFIFFHARRRQHPERPFFVYLDECHRYLSGDIPNIFAEIRKQGIGIVAAHQWLAQLGRADDPIREAVCKGANIKIVFRIKDPREAAELAEAVMPLDLETPVKALVKPAVVGHTRTLFQNTSVGHNRSQTITQGQSHATSHSEAHGRNESTTESESVGETRGTTTTDSDTETFGETDSSNWGLTEVSGSSSSSTDGRAEARDPYPGLLNLQPLRSITDSESTTDGSSSSVAESSGGSHSDSYSSSHGRSVAETNSMTTTRGTSQTAGTSYTETIGQTVGRSTSAGQTTGTSDSRGYSEGIEPLYGNLPSAVHGKENMLYFAAQELLSLTTGRARIAYVGAAGRVMALLQVPPVSPVSLDDASFAALQQRIFARSISAIPMQEAVAALEQREQALIAEAKQHGEVIEPESFRVPARKGSGRSEV